MNTLVTGFVQIHDNKEFGYNLDLYKKRSEFVLSINTNMIIFCDDSVYDFVVEKRKEFENTTIIKITFNELKYSKYIDQITQNREKNQKNYPDPRNTPQYFCATMNKFDMLDQAIDLNPFKSTHFAWIDFGYCQQDANTELVLKNLSLKRDKFSCCLIDYFPRDQALIPERYYKTGGPCTVAAGFMTGNSLYMKDIINFMYEEFISVINSGYGHAEQQLMYILLLKYPELFDIYVGDYHCLLENYIAPKDLRTTSSFLCPKLQYYHDKVLLEMVINNIIKK